MIDLSYTKAQMLADVAAPPHLMTHCSDDVHSREFLSGREAGLRLKGHTPDEILPVINDLLSKRFAEEDEEWLFRGLLYPLKKAVGNAYKRGNLKDPSRRITLEIIATPKGAVVEVSDEGSGFDVAAILNKVQSGEKYFEHSGSGFKQFRKTKSVVSFANGGRTFCIRYLCRQYYPNPSSPTEVRNESTHN